MVAVKIMENISDNKEEMEEEYRVLRDLGSHPNLPNYYGVFFKPAKNREDDQVRYHACPEIATSAGQQEVKGYNNFIREFTTSEPHP